MLPADAFQKLFPLQQALGFTQQKSLIGFMI